MEALLGLFCLVSIGGFCVGFIWFILKKLSKRNAKIPMWLMLLSVIIFIGTMIFGGVVSDVREAPSTEEHVIEEQGGETPVFEKPIVDETVAEGEELTDTERLGVTEAELVEIERVMKITGSDFAREDFERIYRLKDEEMMANPAQFAEYEVTIKGGKTHSLTLNRALIDK